MTTLVGYVPTSPGSPHLGRLVDRLKAEDEARLLRLSDRALSLLAPLAQATSRESLDLLFTHASPLYQRLLDETLQLILLDKDPANDLRELFADLYDHLRSAAESRAGLFGEDILGQYLAVLASAGAMSDWILRSEQKAINEGDAALLRRHTNLANMIAAPAMHANMCVVVLHTIATDVFAEWRLESPCSLRPRTN